eukprot:Anaeramoba_ignava/a347445_97.p1 GENE.a347445_97~~a347445_97.p1  ORF type:complete len:683 (+),score=155.52 a347445_97:2805-4853(+)
MNKERKKKKEKSKDKSKDQEKQKLNKKRSKNKKESKPPTKRETNAELNFEYELRTFEERKISADYYHQLSEDAKSQDLTRSVEFATRAVCMFTLQMEEREALLQHHLYRLSLLRNANYLQYSKFEIIRVDKLIIEYLHKTKTPNRDLCAQIYLESALIYSQIYEFKDSRSMFKKANKLSKDKNTIKTERQNMESQNTQFSISKDVYNANDALDTLDKHTNLLSPSFYYLFILRNGLMGLGLIAGILLFPLVILGYLSYPIYLYSRWRISNKYLTHSSHFVSRYLASSRYYPFYSNSMKRKSYFFKLISWNRKNTQISRMPLFFFTNLIVLFPLLLNEICIIPTLINVILVNIFSFFAPFWSKKWANSSPTKKSWRFLTLLSISFQVITFPAFLAAQSIPFIMIWLYAPSWKSNIVLTIIFVIIFLGSWTQIYYFCVSFNRLYIPFHNYSNFFLILYGQIHRTITGQGYFVKLYKKIFAGLIRVCYRKIHIILSGIILFTFYLIWAGIPIGISVLIYYTRDTWWSLIVFLPLSLYLLYRGYTLIEENWTPNPEPIDDDSAIFSMTNFFEITHRYHLTEKNYMHISFLKDNGVIYEIHIRDPYHSIGECETYSKYSGLFYFQTTVVINRKIKTIDFKFDPWFQRRKWQTPMNLDDLSLMLKEMKEFTGVDSPQVWYSDSEFGAF